MSNTAQNLADWISLTLHSLPPSIPLSIFFEIVVLIIEIQTYFSASLYSHNSLFGGYDAKNNYFFKLISLFDIQQMIVSMQNPSLLWFVLLIILGYLVLLMLSMIISRKSSPSSELQSIYASGALSIRRRIGIWLVTVHGYTFYPICIIANSCFVCISILVFLNENLFNPDLPITTPPTTTNLVLEENRNQLFWVFDETKQCFGGEYFLTATLGFCIHLANILLLLISHQVNYLYPSPRTFSCKRSLVGIAYPIIFMLLGFLKSFYAEFYLLKNSYEFVWILLAIQIVIAGINVVFPTYYELKLNFISLFRPVVIIAIQSAFVIFLETDKKNDSFNYFLNSHISIIAVTLLLFTSLLVKLLHLLLVKIQHSSFNKIKKDNSLRTNRALVYLFEKFKLNQNDLNISLQFYTLFRHHKDHCSITSCHCRAFTSQQQSVNLNSADSVDASNKKVKRFLPNKMISMAQCLILQRLEQIIDRQFGQINNAKVTGSLSDLCLYCMFSILNQGNTKRVFILLSALKKSSLSEKELADLEEVTNYNNVLRCKTFDQLFKGDVASSQNISVNSIIQSSSHLAKNIVQSNVKNKTKNNFQYLKGRVVHSMLRRNLEQFNKGMLQVEWIPSYDSMQLSRLTNMLLSAPSLSSPSHRLRQRPKYPLLQHLSFDPAQKGRPK